MSLSTFKASIAGKIIPPEQLETLVDVLKEEGMTLVTLNGSFDLLHFGHYEMITQASLQGDILLILLNSDASIQAYKSPKRPIHPLEFRLMQIAALEAVDYVSWFEETDPCAILEKVRPHIHVNGSEYGENCIEADVVKRHGGIIHLIERIEGYSTTNIIEKICNAHSDFVNLDSARQSQIEAKRSERRSPSPSGKSEEEDLFGKIAAGPNSQNLNGCSIKQL